MRPFNYRGYKLVSRLGQTLIYSPAGSRIALLPNLADAFDFVDGCTERFSIVYNRPHMEG
jgi:hypothetical protein